MRDVEEFSAKRLAAQLDAVARRLERQTADVRRVIANIEAGYPFSPIAHPYASDVAEVIHGIMGTLANCQLGSLAQTAAAVEVYRSEAKP